MHYLALSGGREVLFKGVADAQDAVEMVADGIP